MAFEIEILIKLFFSMVDHFHFSEQKKDEYLRRLISALSSKLKQSSCHLDQTEFCKFTPYQRYVELIRGLVEFVEQRDPFTKLHLDRTKAYIKIILDNMPNIADAEKRKIIDASELHDIGKAVTPDEILLKSGSLSEKEWIVMREHTVYGAQLLANYHVGNGYLQTAREIARSHHEKYDGSGYPDGLSGDSIPLAARIVHVADVYDAITSNRSYRKKLSPETGIKWILDGSSDNRTSPTHVHPEVLKAFREAKEQIILACRAYDEMSR